MQRLTSSPRSTTYSAGRLPAAVGQPAAVDVNLSAGNERSVIAGKEGNHMSNLFGASETAHRGSSLDVRVRVATGLLVDVIQRGAHIARVDCHNPNATV